MGLHAACDAVQAVTLVGKGDEGGVEDDHCFAGWIGTGVAIVESGGDRKVEAASDGEKRWLPNMCHGSGEGLN